MRFNEIPRTSVQCSGRVGLGCLACRAGVRRVGARDRRDSAKEMSGRTTYHIFEEIFLGVHDFDLHLIDVA